MQRNTSRRDYQSHQSTAPTHNTPADDLRDLREGGARTRMRAPRGRRQSRRTLRPGDAPAMTSPASAGARARARQKDAGEPNGVNAVTRACERSPAGAREGLLTSDEEVVGEMNGQNKAPAITAMGPMRAERATQRYDRERQSSSRARREDRARGSNPARMRPAAKSQPTGGYCGPKGKPAPSPSNPPVRGPVVGQVLREARGRESPPGAAPEARPGSARRSRAGTPRR